MPVFTQRCQLDRTGKDLAGALSNIWDGHRDNTVREPSPTVYYQWRNEITA